MNIIEAAKLMKQGCKVRLGHWCGNEYLYNYLDMIRDERDEEHELSLCDVLDQGWEIYKEEPKLHTFEEALIALKHGKKIKRQLSISEYHLDEASSRILEIYDVEVHNGEAWWGESFSDEEVLANDWIIKEEGKNE